MTDPPPSEDSPSLIIVLSGPSGVGKDAVLSRMRALGKPYHYTVTATTRKQRPNERDGVDYNFVITERFHRMIDGDELLEWAEVYGHLYGVPRTQVTEALGKGRDVIIKADVQGASTIKKLVPEAIVIFLAPPTMSELACRLGERMTESSEALKLRLRTAEKEMQRSSDFDYVVVNNKGRLDHAVEDIDEIVVRERSRRACRRMGG